MGEDTIVSVIAMLGFQYIEIFIVQVQKGENDMADCVSREDLDNAISDLTYWHFENGRLIPSGGGNKAETVYKVDDVTRLTHILPSMTPKRKIGHWVRTTDATEHFVWECDKCEWQQRFATNYCPDCGAIMENKI